MTAKLLELFTTAERFTLPDSSFAFIEPGGKKDDQGKTTPRSLRHLPFKNADGSVELSNVGNALARLNQVKNLPPEKEASIRTMLQNILAKAREADPQATDENLREELPEFLQEAKIDKENGYIRNVFIAKSKSAQRDYDHKALEGIAKAAEGISVYEDHITETDARDRGGVQRVRALIGILENTVKKGARVYADWKLLNVESVKERAFAWAELGARGLGFSIDAPKGCFTRVMASSPNGRERITDITGLASVDIVSRKGMNPLGTLFENNPDNGIESINDTQKQREVLEMEEIKELQTKNSELTAQLKESDDKLKTLQEEKAKADAAIKEQDELNKRREDVNKSLTEAKVQVSSQVVDDLAVIPDDSVRERMTKQAIDYQKRLSEAEKAKYKEGHDVSLTESDPKASVEANKNIMRQLVNA